MPFENGKSVDAPAEASKAQAELSHTEPHTDSETQAIRQELAIAPYREFFGDLSTEDKPKLEYVLNHLNPEDKLEAEEVMAKIRSIDAKFGRGDGENRLNKVYRYLRMFNTIHEHVLGEL